MVKVAVTGGSGLIGSRLIELLRNDFTFIPLPSSQFDITQGNDFIQKLENIEFDILLHLAAYTNVDLAEREKMKAHAINVDGAKNVFTAIRKKGKKMIYVSTDFVFDGLKGPFFEDSAPHPLSYYGQTKYETEQIVFSKAMIVRTAYPYGISQPGKADFVMKILESLKQKKILNMVSDSMITPTYIDDFSNVMKYLIKHFSPDIFHVIGADSLSPYDAALKIASIFHRDSSLIKPTTFSQYSKNKAPRPQFSVMKSKNNVFYKMKTFEEGLEEMRKIFV